MTPNAKLAPDDERQLLPSEIVSRTVESIVAQGTEWRLRKLYFTTLIICLAGIASVFVVRVDVSAMGAGLIRPATDKIVLTAPVAGQVIEVSGKTDLRVRRGDQLMVLSSAPLEADIAKNRTEQERLMRELNDLGLLVRLLAGEKPAPVPEKTDGVDPVRGEVTERPRDRTMLIGAVPSSRAAEVPLQSEIYARDYATYLAEADELRSNRQQAERELRRYETLYISKTVSGQDVDRCRYELEQAKLREMTAVKQRVTRWQTDHVTRKQELDRLKAEAVRLREARAHCTISSPADGTLVDFTPLAPGSFVQQGQRLGDLSPDDVLVAEVFVSPRDVGQIQPGQEVRMQIDAFHYTEWGMLPGRVKRIADDFTLRGEMSKPAFRVFVTPETLQLSMRNGLRAEVRKGMTLQARFVTARRSLFSLLYESASKWMDPHEKLESLQARH